MGLRKLEEASLIGAMVDAWGATLRAAFNLFPARPPPRTVRRLFFAIDLRSAWGANRFKNAQASELTFVATDPGH